MKKIILKIDIFFSNFLNFVNPLRSSLARRQTENVEIFALSFLFSLTFCRRRRSSQMIEVNCVSAETGARTPPLLVILAGNKGGVS